MGRLKVAIMADDLTGALDSAVPFAALGFATVAATSLAGLEQALTAGAEVLALSLSSRELAAEAASARTSEAAQRLQEVPVLLKKIDSRLKGNVAAELQAVLAVRQPVAMRICPAIPDMGRVVRRGMLEGSGIATPISVAASCGLPPDSGAIVLDAETDAELDALVAAAPARTVFVGARGLAAALARHVAGERPPAPFLPMQTGPVAFVIGSRDPITMAQVDRLREGAALLWLAAPDGVVPAEAGVGAAARSLIVQATPGSGPSVSGAAVSARLAEGVVRHHLAGKQVLVLTGGETAAAVLQALEIGALRVLGEAAPGMPVCQALDNPDGPAIVTKSGGFGDAESLLRLVPKPPLAK